MCDQEMSLAACSLQTLSRHGNRAARLLLREIVVRQHLGGG